MLSAQCQPGPPDPPSQSARRDTLSAPQSSLIPVQMVQIIQHRLSTAPTHSHWHEPYWQPVRIPSVTTAIIESFLLLAKLWPDCLTIFALKTLNAVTFLCLEYSIVCGGEGMIRRVSPGGRGQAGRTGDKKRSSGSGWRWRRVSQLGSIVKSGDCEDCSGSPTVLPTAEWPQ